MPKNDLFNTSEAKRYALFSVINAAPEDCAPAKAIREGLVALHWADDRLPPLSNFTGLRHLYLVNSQGTGFSGNLASLVITSQPGSNRPDPIDLEWIYPIKSLRSITLDLRQFNTDKTDEFLKKASFPKLEELSFESFRDSSPEMPQGITKLRIQNLWVSHKRLPELLAFPHLSVGSVLIARKDSEIYQAPEEPKFQPVKVTAVKDRGEPLPAKELAALKKLLRDDSPEIVMQGLKILRTASPATLDALLDKSTVQWDERNVGHFGGYGSGRLGGPLFDSIKRNPLGEAVRMNLLSLAAPGFQPVDDIRKEIQDIDLPPAIVPIDVSGFNGIRRLRITIDPSKPSENWITGMEKLTTLQKLELEFADAGFGRSLQKAAPLGFTPPDNVTEMGVDFSYSEVKVKLDFFRVSSNLRKLKIQQFGPLANLALLKGLDPAKLEELILDYDSSNDQLPPEDFTSLAPFVNLVSISGSRSCLKSLKGVSVFKNLRSINFESDGLEDVAELAQVTSLESLELGDRSVQELPIGDLAALPRLKSLDFGRHRVSDPKNLLKFRPETKIKLQGLESHGES